MRSIDVGLQSVIPVGALRYFDALKHTRNDAVFRDLFSDLHYALLLYRALRPHEFETTISDAGISRSHTS